MHKRFLIVVLCTVFWLSPWSIALNSKPQRVSQIAAPMPKALPKALALTGLPLYYQGYNDCGPASLAMVLRYYGQVVAVHEISRATKATPDDYMSVDAIPPLLSQFGLETVIVHGGQIAHLKRLIALGVPAIVLQYYIEVGKTPHFRIVRGFDTTSGWLYLADPLAGFVRISEQDFNTLWNTQQRTFVAVYPPELRDAVLKILKE